MTKINTQNQQELLTCYHVRKGSLFSIVDGTKAYTFGTPNVLESPALQFAQQNQLWALGISQNNCYNLAIDTIENQAVYYTDNLLAFGDKRLFVLNEDYENLKAYIPLEVDYVLLSGNPKIRNIQEIDALLQYKKLLIDGSNAYWKVKEWEEQCQHLGIDYINTAKEGALVKE